MAGILSFNYQENTQVFSIGIKWFRKGNHYYELKVLLIKPFGLKENAKVFFFHIDKFI